MVQLTSIWNDVQNIVGNSNDAVLFRRLNEAIGIVGVKGEFDPWMATLDVRTSGTMVSMPSEVGTIYAVNMLGHPSLPRSVDYEFHLNGPGSCGPAIRWEWTDLGSFSTFRELACPSQLYAYCYDPADENCELWVEGLDTNSHEIRTGARAGFKVPVFQTQQIIATDDPVYGRITGVHKPVTKGPIRLAAIHGTDEIILGFYGATVTNPRFRKIKLSHTASVIRVRFRRALPELSNRYDLLPFNNSAIVLMMLRAMKHYNTPGEVSLGEQCEATAVRWAVEEQRANNPSVAHPIQVHEGGGLMTPGEVIN